MKPFIGITSYTEGNGISYMVSSDNVDAITRAGGIPIILPYILAKPVLDQIAQIIDGLYLTGGSDIDPILFGEEPHQNLGMITPDRDIFEIDLINKMLDLKKPILGVCRGCQILNIAVGGDMYQDIYAQIDDKLLQHSQHAPKNHGSHEVNVLNGSLLYRLTGKTKLRVNSRHHQANRTVVDTFQTSGRANDGIIEAIESKEHSFVLGLQWHPENMINDQPSRKIFEGFIKACSHQNGVN